MGIEKICCICQRQFVSDPRLKDRQKTCAHAACRKELKRRTNKVWRRKNPDYFKGRYDITLKEWWENNPDYKRDYRQQNPEYVRKNRRYQKAYRKRKEGFSMEGRQVPMD